MPSTTLLTVDLDALAHNYRQIAADAAGAEVAPVVKADGYGLGVGPVARRLWQEGARRFFVARLSEGEALRTALAHREAQIIVLDGLTDGAADRMSASDLTPALTGLDQIDSWGAAGGPRRCVLHFDTGMNRLGLACGEASEAAARLARQPHLQLDLVMSHLARAADPSHPKNGRQAQAFAAVRAAFPGVRTSLAASAGVYLGADYCLDVVRPGISLFGGGPLERPDDRFRAVARLQTPVLQVREIGAGEEMGYGGMYVADRPMRVALLGAGYADGLLRASHARGEAWLNGARAPYLIVTMDMIGVDVAACGDVKPGDMAELLGPRVLLDDVAARTPGTVAHECLVRLSSRAERVYAGGA